MTDREVLQQALDALEDVLDDAEESHKTKDAIKAIRTRLAQPEPEPVAWISPKNSLYRTVMESVANGEQTVRPLYTAPQNKEWAGLTDDEIMDACSAVWASHPVEVGQVVQDLLKERNT